MTDETNPNFLFSGIHTELLVKATKGEIDLQDLAKKEMISRGLNKNGQWVGFEQSQIIWNN